MAAQWIEWVDVPAGTLRQGTPADGAGAFGVLDTAGNFDEWTSTRYAAYSGAPDSVSAAEDWAAARTSHAAARSATTWTWLAAHGGRAPTRPTWSRRAPGSGSRPLPSEPGYRCVRCRGRCFLSTVLSDLVYRHAPNALVLPIGRIETSSECRDHA